MRVIADCVSWCIWQFQCRELQSNIQLKQQVQHALYETGIIIAHRPLKCVIITKRVGFCFSIIKSSCRRFRAALDYTIYIIYTYLIPPLSSHAGRSVPNLLLKLLRFQCAINCPAIPIEYAVGADFAASTRRRPGVVIDARNSGHQQEYDAEL